MLVGTAMDFKLRLSDRYGNTILPKICYLQFIGGDAGTTSTVLPLDASADGWQRQVSARTHLSRGATAELLCCHTYHYSQGTCRVHLISADSKST